ncbi:MAG TPA: class I SAM-dependent methyltransferase [Tabrizicola sp.]
MTQCRYFREFPARTGDRKLFKMEHYLELYDALLADWQGRDVSFLEIGVYKGGSLPMWQGFFGPGSRLVFLDIDPACLALALPGTTVEIGDQADPAFLERVGAAQGPFDLIVDDGGHQMHQQISSFRHLWPRLADRGLYIVEDVHTSYWPGFGGGFREPTSFIEFAKDLIDRMHSWYTEDDAGFPLHPMAKEIGGIRFHDSLVVIEKRLKEAPVAITAEAGKVTRSRRMLEVRGRRSIF